MTKLNARHFIRRKENKMSNYTTQKAENTDCCVPGNSETVFSIVKENLAVASDLCAISHKLRQFMFLDDANDTCNRKDPECLMDDILVTRSILIETAKGLNDLLCRLGL